MKNLKQNVGIIGDGQLGMLLCEAALALDLNTIMLTSDARCAAAQRAGSAIEGAMDDLVAVDALIERCDVITYEREDLPGATIHTLREAENEGRVQCFPPLGVIEVLQDKAKQKRWLESSGLATLPFLIADGSAESQREAQQHLGFPLVQKALRGGFDGRGVQILKNPEALANAWPGETLFEMYAGSFREIAVLVARSRDGDLRHFGPVDMTFEADYAVLDTVSAPADLAQDIADKAIRLAYDAINALEGVGVFGVEMFLLDDHSVLINEISPRVHNAGHYTLEACLSSQFEQHLRAVCDLGLVETTLHRPAAMKNLLCTEALKLENKYREARTQRQEDGAAVYWYGKTPARLMRKLGHISARAQSADEALGIVEQHWQRVQHAAEQAAAAVLASQAPEETKQATEAHRNE